MPVQLPLLVYAPLVAGRAPPVKQTNPLNGLKTSACSPVHVSFVSVVEALVLGDLSGSVAVPAAAIFPGVDSCATALWADDWLVVFHDHICF